MCSGCASSYPEEELDGIQGENTISAQLEQLEEVEEEDATDDTEEIDRSRAEDAAGAA